MFWRTCSLFILCSSLTAVLSCNWSHLCHLNNVSLHNIQNMGGQLTDEDCPVPFPFKFYRRIRIAKEENKMVFIRDSLQLISELYSHDNLSSATWDAVKTDHFLSTVDRQIDELKTCVSSPTATVEPSDLCQTNRTAETRLSRYYRTLAARTLCSTGGSPASWELIRKETHCHLQQLHLLMATMRRRSAVTVQQH